MKIALPIFAQNLEETGKSRAESTDLKEPISPNSVILINSSSAMPLLLEPVLLTSQLPSFMPHTAFLPCHCQLLISTALGASALHNRIITSLFACESQLSCAITFSTVSRRFCLWAMDGGFRSVLFCFVSVDVPGITKFCTSPASGCRDALAAIWPLVHLFPYKCFSLSNHECRIYRIIQYQWKEHIHAWNSITL